MNNILHTLNHNSNTHCPDHRHNCIKLQTYANCAKIKAITIINANFAIMAHTQKAFNQGHSYSHQDTNQNDWSNGDNDNHDPNGQPFQ